MGSIVGMDLHECVRYLGDQDNVVLRFYKDDQGAPQIRVGLDTKQKDVVIIAIRPVTSTVTNAVVEAVNAAAAENAAQGRRAQMRVL